MIPNAAIAILPMHPAAMHPPAIAPPTASSDFPELAYPMKAPMAIALIIPQIHINIIKLPLYPH